MKIERRVANPSRHTFLIKPIREFVMKYYNPNELWIDPFCGENSPVPFEYRNDLNPGIDAKYHLYAKDFLKIWSDESIDGIIYDPPYSLRQLKECYNSIGIEKLTIEESQLFADPYYIHDIYRILKCGGKVIKCGWNSTPLTKKFRVLHLLIVNHWGSHNDTLCTLQVKQQATLKQYLVA